MPVGLKGILSLFLLPLELIFLAGACPPRDFLWVESVAIIDPLYETVILGLPYHSVGSTARFSTRGKSVYPNNIFSFSGIQSALNIRLGRLYTFKPHAAVTVFLSRQALSWDQPRPEQVLQPQPFLTSS